MNLYFCMNDALNELDRLPEGRQRLNHLIAVHAEPPDCGGYPSDVFMLTSTPDLLDINGGEVASQLSLMLENVPLYHFNMELALDEALAERQGNTTIRNALQKAFGAEIMPNTLRGGFKETDEPDGTLRHPMIEHMDKGQLCAIYVDFLRALGPRRLDYNFERNILGKHEEQFLEYFDGFRHDGEGKVKAEILLGFGVRTDHEAGKPIGDHVAEGERKARKMNIRDPQELVWAWLEADHYQMRRCRDIHRVKILEGLPRPPNWIRADIFALLEKEAVKQHLAGTLRAQNRDMTLLDKAPLLKKAMLANAEGNVDELLQQLLSQTLNLNAPYSGAAQKFAEAAARRESEARKARII